MNVVSRPIIFQKFRPGQSWSATLAEGPLFLTPAAKAKLRAESLDFLEAPKWVQGQPTTAEPPIFQKVECLD